MKQLYATTGVILLCILTGCGPRSYTRITPEGPDPALFATWTTPFPEKYAEEIEQAHFPKPYDKEIKSQPDKSLWTKRFDSVEYGGRTYKIIESSYRGEPYELQISGGRHGFFDPIKSIANDGVVAIHVGSRRGLKRLNNKRKDAPNPEKKRSLTHYPYFHSFENETDIYSLLQILRYESYYRHETSINRPGYPFLSIHSRGGAGGSGCDHGIFLQLRSGRFFIFDDYGSSLLILGDLKEPRQSANCMRGLSIYNEVLQPAIKRILKRDKHAR